MKRMLCGPLTALVACAAIGRSAAEAADYLKLVPDYADAMLEQGRDVYGTQQSPLFAEALDRKTMQLLDGDALRQVAALPFDKWGIRPHDRVLSGANPQHCQNPLPKASHIHDHYEAVTNGDTLMLALLQLWQTRYRPDGRLRLVYCDR